MDTQMLATIFEVCIIPILGVLTAFFVKWVNAKSAEINANVDNTVHTKYMNMLTETITNCVIATNQTYVETLKNIGKFDAEAQKEAFKRTSEAVMSILNQDAVEYLSSAVGDLKAYINKKIEAEVNLNKAQK